MLTKGFTGEYDLLFPMLAMQNKTLNHKVS